jgi:hypothetical protein
MLQRIALFIATLAAAFVLVIGLSGTALSPRAQVTPDPTPTLVASQPTDPPVQVDTVYVPAPVPPKTVTIHRNVPPSGERETETGGGGD